MPLRWKRELLALLAECEVTPYRSSGPGGQKKNKTESAVRIRHIPTGIVRIATESRSQSANKLRALERIREAIEERSRRAKPRIPSQADELLAGGAPHREEETRHDQGTPGTDFDRLGGLTVHGEIHVSW